MSQQRPIGVIGAGNMGSGIAQKIATEGFPVVLVDLDQAAVDRGMERIRTLLGEAVERRIFRPAQVEAILARIQPSSQLEACADCEMVIEAIFEDLEVKKKLFVQLDELCAPHTRLATNTSSFYVQDLADACSRPDRVVGMHFFYHPAKNRLVEVIPGEGTSEATRGWAWSFAELIGKTPIHSADAPGFVVNRYFVPWLNESVRLLEEGVADIPTIEASARQAFQIGMGPFELMNVTGVPIALHAASTLGRELGPFYAPSSRLAQQVETGENWSLEGEADPSRFEEIAQRLLGITWYIAAQMIDDAVCSIEDCDIGARVGLRWSLGPFELINRDGLETARSAVQSILDRYEGLEMPALLANTPGPFRFQLVKLEVEDGLAEITLNRPDAMNALNEELVSQLAETFDEANGRADVRTIVLRGSGKAFVAGADIKFFVDRIEEGTVDRIQSFTEQGQALLKRIDESEKLVIVRLDGLSLGGGSELALCGDLIVATEKGSMGFPETGIGIYPGLGGTQRTQRRIGPALTRYLLLSGEGVDAGTALRMGLVDELVGADKLGERIREIHESGSATMQSTPQLDERLQELEGFFADADLEGLLEGKADAPESLAKTAGRIRHKAPVACRLADRMISIGNEEGLEAGLAAELAHLQEIFATEDAYEGLSSLGRRRPEFKGR